MASAPGLSESEVEASFLRLWASRIGCSTRDMATSEQPQNTMKLFYTVIFFSLLASAAFAREESILARVTSYWAGEGSSFASTGRRLHSGHCAVDPKRIPYGSKLSSRIEPAPRSTPDRRSLVAKRLVYADGLRTNSRPSWSTDFLRQSERRWRGRTRIPTL